MRDIQKTAEIAALLTAIRKHEAPKGYGQFYSGAKGMGNADVSKMTLDGVLDFQTQMLAKGSKSTACGGYQFLRKTLKATMAEMGLKGSEKWTPELQDKMAIHLMRKRGLDDYLDGTLSPEGFANNLAKEWASLPVVTAIKGSVRKLTPGQSYYAGDGLNKAFHKPETILALVKAITAKNTLTQAVSAAPAPVVAPVLASPPQPQISASDSPTWWTRLRAYFNRA
jgi:muramidase (phage lysozyme)